VMEVLGVSGSLIPNSSNWAGLSSWLITHARSTGPSLSNSSRRLGVGFSSWRCTLQRLGIPQGQSGVEGWDWDSSRRADRLFPSVPPAIRPHISICSLISVLLSQPDLASGSSICRPPIYVATLAVRSPVVGKGKASHRGTGRQVPTSRDNRGLPGEKLCFWSTCRCLSVRAFLVLIATLRFGTSKVADRSPSSLGTCPCFRSFR